MRQSDRFIRDEFKFFRKYAKSREAFSLQDIKATSGRDLNEESWDTYWSKKWRQFCEESDDGRFIVRRDFLQVDPNDFASVYRQAETLFANYERSLCSDVSVFEFFLPLTHERKLRSNLDALFYEDDLRSRLEEMGADELHRILGTTVDRFEGDVVSVALNKVAQNFQGYSISHVDGRFRQLAIKSRVDAAELLQSGRSYIIDETTAIVRFIFLVGESVPLESGSLIAGNSHSLLSEEVSANAEIIRNLLINIFVRSLVRTVQYEDEIWLLETGINTRLLKLTAKKPYDLGNLDEWYEDTNHV